MKAHAAPIRRKFSASPWQWKAFSKVLNPLARTKPALALFEGAAQREPRRGAKMNAVSHDIADMI